MFYVSLWRAFLAVLVVTGAGAALTFSSSRNVAAPYIFELVEREVKQGFGTTVLVRLVDERTGKTVPDATLFISRLDMSPHGMGAMEAPLEPLPDTLPGYYRFETDLSMGGGWALTLAAKLPGVPDPVQRRLVLQAIR
ncbi:FixH family protein [Microvirga sp. GCM10011540]|uniref:FixH family protein n=1 Tax=Microvirga sp. GCM10011540 TaxID=3317338 RepID=UPI0036184EC8